MSIGRDYVSRRLHTIFVSDDENPELTGHYQEVLQVGKFQKGKSGNPSGRPKGRTDPILASIKQEFGGEPGFWNHVAKAAKNGDQNCINLLAARVRPPFKTRSVCVELNLKGDSASDFTSGVLNAIANGELPPDEGASLLSAILSGEKLEQLEELERRVNQMEGQKNGYR